MEDEFYTPIEMDIIDSMMDEDIEAHDDIAYGDGASDSEAIDAVAGEDELGIEISDEELEDY